MRPLPKLPEYSVFLDTTELHSTRNYVAIPAFVEPKSASVRYYVSRLSVEELAIQLYEDFSQKVSASLEQYPRLIMQSDVVVNLDHFRNSIVADLEGAHVEVFEFVSHGVEEQALLFSSRHRGAYKDALIFSSAVAYAKLKSLPRCSFISQDAKAKDFVALSRSLSAMHSIRLLNRVQFKDMLDIGDILYDEIIRILEPLFLGVARDNRRTLVDHAIHRPDSLVGSTEAISAILALSDAGSDLSKLLFEVSNIVVRAEEINSPKNPKKVVCRSIVRYSISNGWGRLYWMYASATLSYSTLEAVESAQLSNVEFDWVPFG